jgi:two-component system OmpR family sensor kinase
VSLRTRLIIAVLALVTVAMATLSTATYLSLRLFLVSRVDTQLQTTPPDLVERFCGGNGGNGDGTGDHPPGGFHDPPRRPVPILLARLDPQGAPVGGACEANGLSEPLALTPQDGTRLIAAPGRPTEIPAQGSGSTVRAVARPSHDGGGFDVVAVAMDGVSATLHRLLLLELLIGALALLWTGAVGAWAVRWGMRPLDRVTGTARAVATEVSTGSGGGGGGGGGLERRVPAASERTEVGQLAAAFNTMLTAVQTEVAGRQDSEQRMRQFLADASHELRTPLTSLRGYAELIGMRERRAGIERDPESSDALRRMTDEGARMSRLVEDLLVLARSDGSQGREVSRDEPVAMEKLAADAVSDVRAAHPERAVELTAEPASVALGNPDQLRQVLVNLLSNAAVHTRAGGGIRVRVSRVEREIRLEVADDGPGLTPRQAAHVFDRFWRADTARTRARGGSGLGLAIVDTLVGAHGGGIDFDTSPDAGTTVTVRLPAAP